MYRKFVSVRVKRQDRSKSGSGSSRVESVVQLPWFSSDKREARSLILMHRDPLVRPAVLSVCLCCGCFCCPCGWSEWRPAPAAAEARTESVRGAAMTTGGSSALWPRCTRAERPPASRRRSEDCRRRCGWEALGPTLGWAPAAARGRGAEGCTGPGTAEALLRLTARWSAGGRWWRGGGTGTWAGSGPDAHAEGTTGPGPEVEECRPAGNTDATVKHSCHVAVFTHTYPKKHFQ